jgi:hypothetical protein
MNWTKRDALGIGIDLASHKCTLLYLNTTKKNKTQNAKRTKHKIHKNTKTHKNHKQINKKIPLRNVRHRNTGIPQEIIFAYFILIVPDPHSRTFQNGERERDERGERGGRGEKKRLKKERLKKERWERKEKGDEDEKEIGIHFENNLCEIGTRQLERYLLVPKWIEAIVFFHSSNALCCVRVYCACVRVRACVRE